MEYLYLLLALIGEFVVNIPVAVWKELVCVFGSTVLKPVLCKVETSCEVFILVRLTYLLKYGLFCI